MEWMNNPWWSWPFAIGVITFSGYIVKLFWKHVAIPVWRFMVWLQRQQKLHATLTVIEPTLREINEAFRPNGGSSFYDHINRLGDQVTANTRGIEGLQDGQEEILNVLRTHVIDRRSGGQRISDPE